MTDPAISDLGQQAMDHLSSLDAAAGMELATHGLARVRSREEPGRWRELVRSPELAPLRERLQEDPYTRRGFAKPRGYGVGEPLILEVHALGWDAPLRLGILFE